MEFALQQAFRQRVLDQALDGATQGAGAILGIEALFYQEILGSLGNDQFQLLLGQLRTNTLEQQPAGRVHLFDTQGMAKDYFIKTFQELKFEWVLQFTLAV